MKNLHKILVLLMMLGLAWNAQAQCNAELYSQRCLKKLDNGYVFIKSFRIDGKDGARKKVEYTCVFSKGTSYQIYIASADGNATGIIGTLFDPERKKLASNYFDGKFFGSLRYDCRATGIYYLSFTFLDTDSYCGAAVMGFKRQD
jgi:hypothetical protein